MSKAGQSNFQGVEFQVWAGLSLLLQFLNRPGFKEMRLESPYLQDFDVVLENGARYICEVKCWKRSFAKRDLIAVFDELQSRDVEIEKDDTILIIAPKISKDLRRKISAARFYKGNIDSISHWFNDPIELVKKFSQVEFWETDLSLSATIAYSLTAQLIEAIVSPADMRAIVHDLLIAEFVRGSTLGSTITRAGILKRIAEFRNALSERAGFTALDSAKQLEEAKAAALDPHHRFWRDAELTAASINHSQLLVTLKILEKRSDLDLRQWDKLWKGLLQTHLTHFIVNIFSNNLSGANTLYILEFLAKWIPEIRPYYGHSFQDVEILEIFSFLCRAENTAIPTLLLLLQNLINSMGLENFFFETSQHIHYAREKLSGNIRQLYGRGSKPERESIIEFIFANFTVVSDEGEFWIESAPAIYEVLKIHLAECAKDPPPQFFTELGKYTESITKQFEKSSWSKFHIRFKGWEAVGGASAWRGDNYQVWDRHIVAQTLIPSLMIFYSHSPKEAVEVAMSMASITDKQVSRNHPDYSRRMVIPVLIEEYISNKAGMKDESYSQLLKLLQSKRGMPSKFDLIFQSIGGPRHFELRERLLRNVTRWKKSRNNPFVFKQVVELASLGIQWASQLVAKWLAEGSFGDDFYGTGPLRLVEVVAHSNVDRGIASIKRIIETKYFSEQIHTFHIYDWCSLIARLYINSSDKISAFLRELISRETLADSSQTLLLGTIGKLASNETATYGHLEHALAKVIFPLYAKCGWSQKRLSSFITQPHLREEILELCQKVIQKRAERSVNIIQMLKLFELGSDDDSPDPDDKDSDLDRSHMVSIRTVRGRTAWSLQALLIPLARGHFPAILKIIQKLLGDPSAYVRRMACFPLRVLLDRRNQTVTEDGLPAIDENIERAISLKTQIEEVAEEFILSIPASAQKGLTMGLSEVINSMRLVSNGRAERIWKHFDTFSAEVKAERLSFGIFQGEFRQKSLSDPSIARNPMLANIRSEPDQSSWFRAQLAEICASGSEEEKSKFAWLLMKIIDKDDDDKAADEGVYYQHEYDVIFKYFNLLTASYTKSAFVSIYMFIQRNILNRPNECLELYKKTLEVEREWMTASLHSDDSIKKRDAIWGPFAFNGDIILSVAEAGLVEQALELTEILLAFPEGIRIGLGDKLVEFLQNLTSHRERIASLFDRMVQRDPLTHIYRDQWLVKRANQ